MFSFRPVQLALIKKTHWIVSPAVRHTHTHTSLCINLHKRFDESVISASERGKPTNRPATSASDLLRGSSPFSLPKWEFHSHCMYSVCTVHTVWLSCRLPLKRRSKTASIFVSRRAPALLGPILVALCGSGPYYCWLLHHMVALILENKGWAYF